MTEQPTTPTASIDLASLPPEDLRRAMRESIRRHGESEESIELGGGPPPVAAQNAQFVMRPASRRSRRRRRRSTLFDDVGQAMADRGVATSEFWVTAAVIFIISQVLYYGYQLASAGQLDLEEALGGGGIVAAMAFLAQGYAKLRTSTKNLTKEVEIERLTASIEDGEE